MRVNLPDKDFDSRSVMACEDAWDSQICSDCVLALQHVPDFHCQLNMEANVCGEPLSLVLNPDSHAFDVFISFCVCVSQEIICA